MMQDGNRAPRSGMRGLLPPDVWRAQLDTRQAYEPNSKLQPACDEIALGAWPDAFCWTRMQAEAGQPLEYIIKRKERERQAGHGLFFWGVGNPLGGKVAALRRRTPRPQVLFSIMKSKPKPADSAPKQVFLWTCSTDTKGVVKALPQHVVVVSRGLDSGKAKTAHYALVCHSSEPLGLRSRGGFDPSGFRNLGSSNPRVGSSQVTAVLERHLPATTAAPYQVDMVAELVPPYFVRLAGPVPLTPDERMKLGEDTNGCGGDIAQWLTFATQLRTTALGRINRNDLFHR